MFQIISKIFSILFILFVFVTASFALGLFEFDNSVVVNNKKYIAGDFMFSGVLSDGVFHDEGRIDFFDGSHFFGFFNEGRFSGDGVFNADDWRFHSYFTEGSFTYGTLEYNDGRNINIAIDSFYSDWSFEGIVNENGQTGQGIFIFADGLIYKGDFENGFAHGLGVLLSADGEIIYEGSFAYGFFDGFGIYRGLDGRTVEGLFNMGVYLNDTMD